MTGSTNVNHLGVTVPLRYLTKGSLIQWMNEWIREVFVEQPLASPGSAKKSSQGTPKMGKQNYMKNKNRKMKMVKGYNMSKCNANSRLLLNQHLGQLIPLPIIFHMAPLWAQLVAVLWQLQCRVICGTLYNFLSFMRAHVIVSAKNPQNNNPARQLS